MKFALKFTEKYLGSEIFENGGEVDRSTGANTLRIATFLHEPSDTANGELKTGFGGF